MTSLRKRVTVGLLGAALVGGGGIAFAASQSSDPRDAYLDDVAKRLNVTPEKLREAMKGASLDQLEQAVKDGKLTQEQADRVKQKIEAGGVGGPVLGIGRRFGGGRKLHGGPGFGIEAFGAELDAVAKYLGLSAADVRKQIADGKSLADIAKAQNRDLAGLEKVITDAIRKRFGDDAADRLSQRLDELLKMSLPQGLRRGGPRFAPGAPGLPAVPRGHGFGLGAFGADIEAVAKHLGLSTAKLREQIAGGKSLADIAKAQNKDVAGLQKVITDAVRKRFGDDAAERIATHLDRLLEMSLPAGLRRHP